MAGNVDAFLKVSIAASLLLVAGSVGYYYSIYLPRRDAQLDRERQLERARVEITQKANAARLQAEKEEAESKAASKRLSIQGNYDACLRKARNDYDRAWAFACAQVAERSRKGRAECTFDKAFCDKTYPIEDPSPNCSLRRTLSASIDDDHGKARDRCLFESKAGLQ